MNKEKQELLSKVPEVTLIFWIIKVLATTLGETGGDAVTMSWLGETTAAANGAGYLVGTAIFGIVFLAAVLVQIKAKKFHPVIYWITIIATTTVGTTLADFADRSLGIGYMGGTAILFTALMASLFVWHRTLGTVAVDSVSSPKSEMFYWVTIMFSQTLGTALGDFVADGRLETPAGLGLGYGGSAMIFGGALALIALAYYRTRISHTVLFWAAFILTRPLGAVVGDFLDKPIAKGGLALSRYSASATLLALILACIFFFSHKPAEKHH